MSNKININIGDKFFRWTVISESNPLIRPDGKKRRMINVRCDCGKEKIINMDSLRNGKSKSCGCYSSEQKHLNTGMIYGVGVNDYDGLISQNLITTRCYNIWHRMIRRCYSKKSHILKPTYINCKVCSEWLYFSCFKKWCENNYVDNYDLDKDILVKGNRIYSPQTCCFVPHEINNLFIVSNSNRNQYIGAHYHSRDKIYESNVSIYGKLKNLGRFATPELAFAAYKKAKESHIKNIANKWKDKIVPNVYEALMKYEVEITD